MEKSCKYFLFIRRANKRRALRFVRLMRACEKYNFVSLRIICSRHTHTHTSPNEKIYFAIYHHDFVFYRSENPITFFILFANI